MYRNLSPSRPVIHKLKDTLKVHKRKKKIILALSNSSLQPEGNFANKSETSTVYQDNHAERPVIHKLRDHGEGIQPEGNMAKK